MSKVLKPKGVPSGVPKRVLSGGSIWAWEGPKGVMRGLRLIILLAKRSQPSTATHKKGQLTPLLSILDWVRHMQIGECSICHACCLYRGRSASGSDGRSGHSIRADKSGGCARGWAAGRQRRWL